MNQLSQEKILEYRTAILKAVTESSLCKDGWCAATNIGTLIKRDALIDYKAMGFEMRAFLKVVLGRELQSRGQRPKHEYKLIGEDYENDNQPTSYDQIASASEQTPISDAVSEKHATANSSVASYIVRNVYRELMKDPSSQNGWVKVRDVMTRVNWSGNVTEFAKRYNFQIKAPNLVRISNISRYEILDDIYFDSKRNPYPKNLSVLQKMALKEPWEDNGKTNGLLDNYLCYTYARVKEDDKIALSDDKLSGCWNTGLVDLRYLPIYCYMTRKGVQDRWVFQGFCIDGEGLGKVMASKIAVLPKRALYFTTTNLLFESDSNNLSVDYDHIITEHPSRLPKEWLKRALGSGFSEQLDTEDAAQYDERIGTIISKDEAALPLLQTLLKQAIEISLMRCEWNYKTAIPYYDPNSKNIGWFLPLCTRSKDGLTPFAALVVTKENSGRYQGQTIYKLSWAYRCARLVCRPDSDWLSPNCASDEDDNQE